MSKFVIFAILLLLVWGVISCGDNKSHILRCSVWIENDKSDLILYSYEESNEQISEMEFLAKVKAEKINKIVIEIDTKRRSEKIEEFLRTLKLLCKYEDIELEILVPQGDI